jgi:tetratricopeptide (TPR) repeat protein
MSRPERGALALAVVASAAVLAACGASSPVRSAATMAQESAPVTGDSARVHEHAIAALQAGELLEAELLLEQLLAEHPQSPGALLNLAIVYREDGRGDQALELLERANALDPGHPEANLMLGIARRERGEFAAAERAYRRAIETRPDYALAHYNLAVLLDLYLHRSSEALDHYQLYQLLLAEPDQSVARWIIDLRRRLGANDTDARVARGDGL